MTYVIVYLVIAIIVVALLIYEYIKDVVGLFKTSKNDGSGFIATFIFIGVFWPVSLAYWVFSRFDKLFDKLQPNGNKKSL